MACTHLRASSYRAPLRAEAICCIVERISAELITAIQAVYRGDSFLSPSVSKTVIDEYLKHTPGTPHADQFDKLTDREREVLQLLAEGRSAHEIADQLQVSVKTVGVHRTNIMDKLGIHNVPDLVKYALRKGIISLD